MRKLGMLAAFAALAVLVQGAAADLVTNVTVKATPPMPAGTQPVLIRLHKQGAAQEFDSCPGTFQIVHVGVTGALADDGTVIVNRKNASVTNAIATVTASSGAGTANAVDAEGYASAHLVYRNRSGASYSNADDDKIVLTGTATNAIVELRGWRWY